MGKHETAYRRIERDHYPTPRWPADVLAQHVELRRKLVWEPAAGSHRMARALERNGATVYTSDVVSYRGREHDAIHDFVSNNSTPPGLPAVDLVITNPPFGPRGKLAEAFIQTGLRLVARHGVTLALLLPRDFDSAVTRRKLFDDCPHYYGSIVLLHRIVWFRRHDGRREAPKENSAWFLWARNPLRLYRQPFVLYAQRPTV